MTINLESIRSARAEMFKNELPVSMVVGGQNSWELGGVEMEFLRII